MGTDPCDTSCISLQSCQSTLMLPQRSILNWSLISFSGHLIFYFEVHWFQCNINMKHPKKKTVIIRKIKWKKSSTMRRQLLAADLYQNLNFLSHDWAGSLHPHFVVMWKRFACQMWVSNHSVLPDLREYSSDNLLGRSLYFLRGLFGLTMLPLFSIWKQNNLIINI